MSLASKNLCYKLFISFVFTASLSHAHSETNTDFAVQSTDFISLKDATGIYNGSQYFAGILAIGDVNGDGYDDILTGALTNQTDYPRKVSSNKTILLTYDNNKKKFVVDEQYKLITPNIIWPRRAVIDDIDGDGDNDIFIAGHGTDGRILHCGDKNVFIEQTADGLKDSSSKIPNISDYSHGLSVSNFDRDGALELIIFNSPYILKAECPKGPIYSNGSYMLDLDGSVFKRRNIRANSSDINLNEESEIAIHTSVAGDLNKDGYTDIVIGTDFNLKILYGNETLTFRRASTIKPPKEYQTLINTKSCNRINGVCATPYSDFMLYDFDGDGDNDIIASLLNQRSDYQWIGGYLQAIRNDGDKWTDVTNEIFLNQNQDQSSQGRWCFSLDKADIDLDGRNDIICSQYRSYSPKNSSSIWLYRDGKFIELSKMTLKGEDLVNINFQKSSLQVFLSRSFENIRKIRLGKTDHLVGVITNDNFVSFKINWIKLAPIHLNFDDEYLPIIPKDVLDLDDRTLCIFSLNASFDDFSKEDSKLKYIQGVKMRNLSFDKCSKIIEK